MKKMRIVALMGILVSACALLAIMSCGRHEEDRVVYVAGFALADEQKGMNVPVYWKDGQIFELSRLDPNCSGYAHSIVADSHHVYVAGDTLQCFGDGSNQIATAAYWKDGSRVDLAKPAGHGNDASVANQIAVSHGSVYVAGFVTGDNGFSVPVYWKDGQIINLEMPDGARGGAAHNIAVNGADIYVTGVVLFDDFYPLLWKNGTAQILPRPYEFRGMDVPYPIAFSGTDVYVFGTVHHIPSPDWDTNPRIAGWKNGEFVPLFPLESSDAALAYDGAIKDGADFRAGIYFEGLLYTPALWVNGARQRLPMPDENLFGMARDLFIESGEVYVAGANFVEDPGNPGQVLEKPCYWSDGGRVDLPTLSPGAGFAYDIFVTR